MPRVSVCCSVLNQSGMLLEMIQAVVDQTFTDWELIVVDDGSTDPIKAVVDRFKDSRIIYERFPDNRGIPHGINHAFSLATGDYIQPLAADEILAPTKLEEQVKYLDEHPEIDCVWGLPQFCGSVEERTLGPRPEYEQFAMKAHNRSRASWLKTLLLLDNVPLGSCSALWRRSLFDSIGYFDNQLTSFCDHEWYCRFFEKHDGIVLPHRWALCVPHPDTVRAANPAKNEQELRYVREKHKMVLPSMSGTVTVGIPVYNMAHFIPDAIKSILAQTHQPVEILILDDASTDNIAEVVAKFEDPRIKFMRFDENRGNMEAQNQMLARAEGEFFVPLSADDAISPDHLEKCLAEFAKNPFLEFVSTQTDFIDDKGKEYADKKHPFHAIERPTNKTQDQWKGRLYYGNVYFGAGMYRRSAVLAVGGWSKEFGVIADYEMYLRLLQRENIQVIEENLTHTRIHDKNQSLLQPESARKLRQQYHAAKKRYYQPRMKVIIATPFYELKGFSPYISSIVHTVKMLTQLGIEHEFWELSGDSYVHRARNTICTKFLEDPDATDLFFLDSDMQWNPDAFVKMLMLPEEVVGGSYPVKNNWAQWTSVAVFQEEENGKRHPIGRFLGDGSALIQAEMLSAGFLRLKRTALEKFRDHYPDARYKEPFADPEYSDRDYIAFFEAIREDGLLWGEDMMFSRRLKQMGMPLWIYPNVEMGHYGVKGWTGNYDRFLRGNGTKQDNFKESIH